MRFLKNLIQRGSGILSGIKRFVSPSQRSVKELTPLQKVCAIIAKQAYEHPNRLQTIPYYKGVWELDNELSNTYFCVYVNYQERTAILGVRGTEITDISDLSEDIKIIQQDLNIKNQSLSFSSRSLRLREAREKYDKMREKYKSFKYITASHSLGARISKELARQYSNLQAITFNSGGLDAIENIRDRERRNIQDITSGTDLISIGSLLNPNTIIYNPRRKIFSHTIDAFL